MKPSPLDREIRSRIDSFLGEISSLVRLSALEAVHGALGGQLDGQAAAPARAASASAPRRSGKRAKRSSEDVQATADTVLAYIKKNKGQRLEQISKGLGRPSKELKLPVQKLFEAKAIKTKGAKRGTMYFAR